MSEDGSYLEHIESEEIKKLVELIYQSKPENTVEEEINVDKHEDIIKQIDQLPTPRQFPQQE